MSDDFNLDDLKSAMNAATPTPDADAKAKNIALATKNFAKREAALQGSRNAARLTTRPTKWTGVKTMLNKLTSRSGLTVTTAIVACGFMIGTPQGRDILNLTPAAKVAEPETSIDMDGSDTLAAELAIESGPAAPTGEALDIGRQRAHSGFATIGDNQDLVVLE